MSTSVIADEVTSDVSVELPVVIAQEDIYSEGITTLRNKHIYVYSTHMLN